MPSILGPEFSAASASIQIARCWYPGTVPAELGGNNSALNNIAHADLDGREFDYIIVGAGIAGLNAARVLADSIGSGSILVIDRGPAFGEMSGISGGEISPGFGTGNEWLRAAVGRETADEIARHMLLDGQDLLYLADRFEALTGHKVRTGTGMVTAITDEASKQHVRQDLRDFSELVRHDAKKFGANPPPGILSVGHLTKKFTDFKTLRQHELMGGQRYKGGGRIMPGEGSVNPAMLGMLMRYLATGDIDATGNAAERNPAVKAHFAEYLNVHEILPESGTVHCRSARERKDITLRGKKIILAGVPPRIINGVDLDGADWNLQTRDYRTLIGVTKPLDEEQMRLFRIGNRPFTAFQDTDEAYNYMWLDPVTHRVMWGSGDFVTRRDQLIATGKPLKPHEMPPYLDTWDEKIAFIEGQMKQSLWRTLDLEYIWEGDIPYSRDGLPVLFEKGVVRGFYAPGGTGILASYTLAKLGAKATAGHEPSQQLFQALQQRQKGFDPLAQAKKTAPYMLSAPFKLAEDDGWVLQVKPSQNPPAATPNLAYGGD